jgi:large subunit ribosomal protein L27e
MSKKFLKSGKVVVLLQGRYAGKKAVIVRQYDDGHGDRHYGHCVVAGIDKAPLKITKKMEKKKVDNRSKLKAFLKIVNYNHMMPTRYTLSDIAAIKEACKTDLLTNDDYDGKKEAAKVVQKEFKAKYQEGKNKWFFSKLRF